MPESQPMVSPGILAAEFSRILHEWLTADELAEIQRRNSTLEYSGFCASHDFCDPNQAMIDALSIHGLEFDTELCGLINDAWAISRMSGFHSPVTKPAE